MTLYVISDVKDSGCVLCFEIYVSERRGGEMGGNQGELRECKFQNKSHWTFDIRNNSTPEHFY